MLREGFVEGPPTFSVPVWSVQAPTEFLDVDRMKVQFLCRDEEVPKILDFYEKTKLPHRLIEISPLQSASESDLSRLTAKQRQALLAAYSLGYYDVPRRIFFRRTCKAPQARNLDLC